MIRSVCTRSVWGVGGTVLWVGRKIAVPSVGIYSKCSLPESVDVEAKGEKCIRAFFLISIHRRTG